MDNVINTQLLLDPNLNRDESNRYFRLVEPLSWNDAPQQIDIRVFRFSNHFSLENNFCFPLDNKIKDALTIQQVEEKQLNDSCPICIQNYTFEQKIIILPCKHFFHSYCIKEWFNHQSNCPNCRYNIGKIN
jgi:hypothetical protein